jgi:hypothetical protein
MSSPELALIPAPIITGTGTGATTRTARQQGLRHHTLCENTDGKQEDPEGGRFMARHGPGAPPFPLLPGPGSRLAPVRGRA